MSKVLIGCIVAVLLCVGASQGATFDRLTIVTGANAGSIEQHAAELLAARIKIGTDVTAQVFSETSERIPETGLVVLFGVPSRHTGLRDLLLRQRIPIPSAKDPGAEGFLLQAFQRENGLLVAAAGVDDRGALYAVGEILRRVIRRDKGIEFPASLTLRTAPAFRWRGTEVSQGATMVELTHATPWTTEQWRKVVLDYALAGANIFSAGTPEQFEFLKSYGLMAHGGYQPNSLPGHPEWKAVEPIGRENYVCLSYPEARKAILANTEASCKNSLPYDVIRIPSGDAGGCWCARCEPWGKTYIEMSENIAQIVHKYLPDAKVFATNQELSNAGDMAIFDHFKKRPNSHLAGLFYGPGSNAMSWNGTKRPDHRLDLFEYPAFGVYDRYVREIVHNLPDKKYLMFFTDLTHWVASQYGFMNSWTMPDFNDDMPPMRWDHQIYDERPDPAFWQVYNRRTFFARPRAYYHVFEETQRYGEGDISYSEGHHDQFNQWMWQRLLWNPHVSVENVVAEYCTAWFGPEAAPDMAQALFQMEQNLTAPLAGNDGIDRYFRLVTSAGEKMPPRIMKESDLWRMHMQKACIDKYVQLRVQRQFAAQEDIRRHFDQAVSDGELDSHISWARERLKEPPESDEMVRLRAQAGKLGEESNALFGTRSEGWFNLDQDLTGLGWVAKHVEEAANASAPERKRALIRLIAHYQDPGEGGFYDVCGDPARSPHLVKGWPYSVNNRIAGTVSSSNLPSQNLMAYTTDSSRGVTLQYGDLDKSAHYRIRFSFVRPRFAPRFAARHPENSQSIYANGNPLAKDVPVPEWEAGIFEYDIPKELTAGGELTVWLEKASNVAPEAIPETKVWKRTAGWGTIVSEVWLMKQLRD